MTLGSNVVKSSTWWKKKSSLSTRVERLGDVVLAAARRNLSRARPFLKGSGSKI